jgi:hypothetical protein
MNVGKFGGKNGQKRSFSAAGEEGSGLVRGHRDEGGWN